MAEADRMPGSGPDSGQFGWSSDRQPRRQTRKAHRKSRNGCQHCKRRRVKCDEVKPICGNCAHLSIPCSFGPPPEGDVATTSQLARRKRGRPARDWSAITFMPVSTGVHPSASTTTTPPTTVSSASPDLDVEPPLYLPWTVEDLELLHHWYTRTAPTLGDTPLWRDRVPRLAFRHHCVLHLLLALSGLHLLRLDEQQASRFEAYTESHLVIGLRQAMDMLPTLNEDNCEALYISTVLVCSCTFAKRPGRRHLLVFADGNEVAWWELFRGVRFVVDSIGIERIFAGELGPLAPEVPVQPHVVDDIAFPVIQWEEPVGMLAELLPLVAESVRNECREVHSLLAWCYEESYGTSANPKDHVAGQFERIMIWLYNMADEFILQLKAKEPVPLVFLAYYAVLLQLLERFWYMRGWATHVLQGITELLDPAYAAWLEWPAMQFDQGLIHISAYREANEARNSVRSGVEVVEAYGGGGPDAERSVGTIQGLRQ